MKSLIVIEGSKGGVSKAKTGLTSESIAIFTSGWDSIAEIAQAKLAKQIKEMLAKNGMEAIILKRPPRQNEEFSTIIFFSRLMLQRAREIKRENPEKRVILLTHPVFEADRTEGIILVEDGELEMLVNLLTSN